MTVQTPEEIVRALPPLEEAVEPLCQLARINPGLLPSIIHLAMAMGAYAGARQMREPDHEAWHYKDLERAMHNWKGLR